jgi:hypothetical protein
MLNIPVSAYYITSGTLQVVSEHFPWHELWVKVFSRVETCTIDVFKAQRYIIQWVKLWWGKLHTSDTNGFMGFPRNQSFSLVGNLCNPCWYPRVVLHQTKYVHDHHSHVPIGISGVP